MPANTGIKANYVRYFKNTENGGGKTMYFLIAENTKCENPHDTYFPLYIQYPFQRSAKFRPVLIELIGQPLSTGKLFHCEISRTKDRKDYKLIARRTGKLLQLGQKKEEVTPELLLEAWIAEQKLMHDRVPTKAEIETKQVELGI